ncbi:MAG: HdeA/HdeB family chaperone [Pseudomonadales bacterium]|jgi:hypothetical protein|nr:HdeA/HdeB family chaperone [Pseudomonadales bacterium]
MTRIAGIAAALMFLCTTAAATEAPERADVTATTCAELAEGTELDRAFSLLFYYGYLAGREGITVIDPDAVPGHLEAVRDFCNANPDSSVIDAFVSALQT